jgi:hypothetical protein
MSDFYDKNKIRNFKKDVIFNCKEHIQDKLENLHPSFYNFWLDDPHEMCDIYIIEFKKQFNDQRFDEPLWNSGKQLGYLIKTLLKLDNKLYQILKFIEIFINEQINDFINLYSHLLEE